MAGIRLWSRTGKWSGERSTRKARRWSSKTEQPVGGKKEVEENVEHLMAEIRGRIPETRDANQRVR
jgi:hypothetical protein